MLLGLVLAIAALILFTALTWWRLRPAWMGFSGKTLWDWLATMMNATVLGLGTLSVGIILQQGEANRLNEESLQAYLDRIAALHLDADRPAAEREALARAHTSAILSLVDGPRAGRVLRFLDDLGALSLYVTSLEGAQLAGAELKGTDFGALNFEEADLSGADLEYSTLEGADFEEADLRNADLKHSVLHAASFEGARMKGAELNGADLRGADLSKAGGLTRGQLETACIDPTTRLPEALRGLAPQAKACAGL